MLQSALDHDRRVVGGEARPANASETDTSKRNGTSELSAAPTDEAHSLMGSRRPRVLLGVSGSVAAIKTEELAQRLSECADVRLTATDAAMHFVDRGSTWGSQAMLNQDDWARWRVVGDPVEHIDLRRWADLLVIAPLSANTLAKIAQGLCDNLLTCVVRAWDVRRPLLVAPAMNTTMWESPFTGRHLTELQMVLGARIIPPVVKKLACGDVGTGAMAAVEDIVAAVSEELRRVEALQRV